MLFEEVAKTQPRDIDPDVDLLTTSQCIPADQLISTPAGLKYVGEIFTETGIGIAAASKKTPYSYPLLNREGDVENTSALTNNGSRPVHRITTRSGTDVKATANHPFLVVNESGWWVWRRAAEIRHGEFLVTVRGFYSCIGSECELSLDDVYFLGVCVADANLEETRVGVTNDDPVIQEAILTYGSALIGKMPRMYTKAGPTNSLAYHFNSKVAINELYERLGWKVCLAATKEVGAAVRGLDREGVRAFLQGYFDCECSIDRANIEVSSASRKLLFEVKMLLLVHFGINAILKEKIVAAYPEKQYWRLLLYGAEAVTFVSEVGFRSHIRNTVWSALPDVTPNPNVDTVPNIGSLLEAVCDSSETTQEHLYLVRDYKGTKPRSRPSYRQLGKILDFDWSESHALQRLRQIHDADYYYDEVMANEIFPNEPTFDFTLPTTHSFVMNGVITHNSNHVER